MHSAINFFGQPSAYDAAAQLDALDGFVGSKALALTGGQKPLKAHTHQKGRDVDSILIIDGIAKTYKSGVEALKPVTLSIARGEIFALLGPNGAGKTTLIGIICGQVTASAGRVVADGHDTVRDYRAARAKIGLVPQEISTDAFETVWDTVKFSRGLFGLPADPGYLEKVLRDLSLWDKKDAKIMTLSGGMKRRVMIAKALSHEPSILFLDEPSAGVDVELRRDMWTMVRGLREAGVTIILTTHYIEEAEDMADRVGVINKGRLILVEEKAALMRRFGARRLTVSLTAPLSALPAGIPADQVSLEEGGLKLVYRFDASTEDSGVAALLRGLDRAGVDYKDLHTEQSSLEDIFVSLVSEAAP
jgi:ABC-2 type transport system ATP-binding protein